jgi:2-polyprenyl-6-methoxyphenol hydroxylase-like FAD-dependent oxidoreductase
MIVVCAWRPEGAGGRICRLGPTRPRYHQLARRNVAWGIYDRAPLPYWSTERITLMGDAAHPMVPHIGQRAGQSIEDGFTLAVLLESCTSDKVADRLRLYKAIRLERTSKVQALARAAGKLYRSEHDDPSEKAARLREWMAQGMRVFAHDAEILSLGPYRYPVEDKTRASDKPAVDIPATERA